VSPTRNFFHEGLWLKHLTSDILDRLGEGVAVLGVVYPLRLLEKLENFLVQIAAVAVLVLGDHLRDDDHEGACLSYTARHFRHATDPKFFFAAQLISSILGFPALAFYTRVVKPDGPLKHRHVMTPAALNLLAHSGFSVGVFYPHMPRSYLFDNFDRCYKNVLKVVSSENKLEFFVCPPNHPRLSGTSR